MKTSTRLLIAAGLLATLAACGNKGPLVLPSPPADSETPVPAAPPASAPTPPPETPTPPADTGTPAPTPPPADDGSTGDAG